MSSIVDNEILASPLLEQMPGWMFVKDLEFQYTATTRQSALLCGFKQQHDKYGKTDFELKCKAAESAVFFQEQDQLVISQDREISFLQLNEYADARVHVFLTKKIPLKNSSGTIIGVCGIVDEISNHATIKAILQLANSDKTDSFSSLNKRNFEIDGGKLFQTLSEDESKVIFYFIRGFSSKEMGLLMQLNTRTVDAMLVSLQNRFNCDNLKDLYTYCLDQRAYANIPQTLLRECINKRGANNRPNIKIAQRQKECINLLLTGATSSEMAQKLNVSPRTIESYLEVLKSKFHARNKADLLVKLCRYYPLS